jgi:hypothetical protein
MLRTHKSVVATADNASSSLRSGCLDPAVPHFKRSAKNMKSLIILLLFVALTACKEEVAVVSVYDEVTTFTEDHQTTTTGAKLYLIDNVGLYSNIKVTLIHEGGLTELVSYGLASKAVNDIGMSLRFYPDRDNERYWSLCYRQPTEQEPIYSELIANDWYVANPNRSRYGGLRKDIEVIDSFVLMRSGKFFDVPTRNQLRACFTQDDFIEFSRGKDYVKFIRITLEK